MFESISECPCIFFFSSFFFNDTATTEIYTLSLHDALPISPGSVPHIGHSPGTSSSATLSGEIGRSTRLNSSHVEISYAVFCLKKKKKKYNYTYILKKKKEKNKIKKK